MPLPLLETPYRCDGAEMIDALEPPDSDFAASFGDVARINRYLGGTRAVLQALGPLLQQVPVCRNNCPVRILDIATGSADIPRSMVRWARRQTPARPICLVATDHHPKVLNLARRRTPADRYPEIAIECADALCLPYADGSFDIALCSLTFHHLGWEGCITVLREMERVTRVGFVVNDLVRGRIPHALIWFLTRITLSHRFTRHDGPLSVLRSYTVREYEEMAAQAGISCQVRRAPMYRAVLVRTKDLER